MNKTKRSFFNFLLGAITCVLVIGLSVTPSFSKVAPATTQDSNPSSFSVWVSDSTASTAELNSNLQAAESVLIAQGMADSTMKRYTAILLGSNVFPNAPSTSATGAAGAALVGDRLVVRGDFSGLSGALRDYAIDPVNPPNPNITSAVHIHRGEPTQNGPFQYALNVTLNGTGRDGRFAGEYTLTSEQLQALADGKLYVDLHTKTNRAGELRGIFRPI